ncbi:MAG TPA: hypothetical protein VG321_10790 [Solirubrobacteraceae bacterium]|nr:hypothetical protein [Solirubrobacteraceae bacterium]
MTAGPSSLPTDRARTLAVCDGLLREVGRREHRFSWLRDPDGPDDRWLVVDGYYPSNKVLVYCGDDPDELRLYHQLVPQHGLYLLEIEPQDLPDDQLAAQALLRKQLQQDGWSPRPQSRPVTAPPPPERAREPVSAGRWTEVQSHGHPAAEPHHAATAGFAVGLLLIVVVLIEAYLGLVVLAIDNADPVLGAGVLLDAATRAFGTLAARQRHDPEQSWSSLVLGSPAVAGQEQPAKAVAILALILVGLGIVVAVL